MGVIYIENNIDRAKTPEDVINCTTGIPRLDALLHNMYSKSERIKLAEKRFRIKIKRKINKSNIPITKKRGTICTKTKN